ncbi:S4 domain-containing protein [Candidatus Malacoplasma girerdii]|uniref:S4 domain-containing protein n=1 Tax=Candidatus Malacoplasma girerdii TaxID=1318617 RepID=A0A097SSE9_9BACT|nr:S4 domain-containing protein [Candidatus Malacoplasma girerdii]ASJ89109.1 MAG: S4 domain-contaiming protein [Candidatus Malacoplasma girerdii]
MKQKCVFNITTEYIQLQQLLKLLNFIPTGGYARNFLVTNNVYVNGVIEKRRGKKLYPNDEIMIKNTLIVIKKESY